MDGWEISKTSGRLMHRIFASAALCLVSTGGCAGSIQQPAPSSAVDQIAIKSETLSSGYRVVIARTPPIAGQSARIYVGSYALYGSMQEDRSGWAHLMEHVVANNRSTVAGPARPQGINFIEGNALTRPYYTSFVSVLPPPLLASTVHSRMARLGRTENDSAVFATQAGRVLAELERDMTGQYPAYKAVVALALGKSPRLSDELELVRNTNREELGAAIAPIYKPDNGMLVIVGDLNVDSTRALVQETEARLQLSEVHGAARSSTPTLRMNQSAVVDHQNRSGHYVVGIAWAKPQLGDHDEFALLIANQLILGRGISIEDPSRSDSSPVAVRLARSVGGSSFWDGRAGKWGAPDLIDAGPGVNAILFNTDRNLTVQQVRDFVAMALRDIRANAMSDKEIDEAKENLASFYERWFFEPTYRVLADHLMAYAASGRHPEEVKRIPSQIRRVRPADVRAAFNRYYLKAPSNVAILPPDRSG